MISARSVATLGFGPPPTPRLIAVLGLWPVDDDPEDITIDFADGADDEDPVMQILAQRKRRKRMQAVILATVAALSAQGILK